MWKFELNKLPDEKSHGKKVRELATFSAFDRKSYYTHVVLAALVECLDAVNAAPLFRRQSRLDGGLFSGGSGQT